MTVPNSCPVMPDFASLKALLLVTYVHDRAVPVLWRWTLVALLLVRGVNAHR